ncbi:MAG TPA: hypothetical protein VHW00_13845 [Thermoanaerobaculia bacterium]|nr:hypothetical protein [Thermoanaerobaculia bacterium]
MRLRLLAAAGFLCALVSYAPVMQAGCGSASCPLDLQSLNRPTLGGFTLDLSFQYIDLDQPRIGTDDASAGELHGPHHDEVRTINRIATATLGYAPTSRLQLTAALPWISRTHDHLASNHAHVNAFAPRAQHNVLPEAWDIRGVGDVTLQARFALREPDAITHSAWWIVGGVKLPTGDDSATNDDGEVGELPIQAGSGTTDGLVGISYEGGLLRHSRVSGAMGDVALLPYFFTATYQFRGGANDGYRLGSEWQLNAGTAYALGRHFEALLQVNSRFRGKDTIEEEPEEGAFTGGTYVYASPGVRVPLGRGAVYALVQLPLYRDVNAIQLTSDANYIAGFQTRF